ncbi:hypothetical protein Tco_1380210 [Tanacetum coccineum]
MIEQIEDIQARMDADALLAERLQQEEREQFTIKEKSRMLVEMIVERKSQLKSKSFEEIQKLYEKEQKWINDFVPMDSKEGRKKVESSKKEAASSKKRQRSDLDDENVKRQKTKEALGLGEEQSTEKEKELSEEKLQKLLVIIPVEEFYVKAL